MATIRVVAVAASALAVSFLARYFFWGPVLARRERRRLELDWPEVRSPAELWYDHHQRRIWLMLAAAATLVAVLAWPLYLIEAWT